MKKEMTVLFIVQWIGYPDAPDVTDCQLVLPGNL
jgi:hypothetical protein